MSEIVFKWLCVSIVVAVIAIVALATIGAARWRASTRMLIERLEAASAPIAPERYDSARELEGLPAPVARFFQRVLVDGQPIVASACVEHAGMFNTSESGERWTAFTSRQRVITRRPGFVWDGRMSLLPGARVYVHDAYIAGEGILHPSLLGLATIVDLRGTSPERGGVAHGELLRFLAEAAWYPTALLPSRGVHWAAVDETSARATMRDGPISVALTFSFAPDGMIEAVRADARGRTVGGKVVLTPWEGRWSNGVVRDGMRVPMTGEVAWLTNEGRKPYWRGTITALSYEFAGSHAASSVP